MNVCPPIVSVPVRDVVAVFAVTLYATFPLPVPVAPTPMVIQSSLLTAVQLQVALAVTVMFPLPASDEPRVADAGDSVTRHGTPGCVTVNVWPPIVRVPVRLLVLVLAATL